MVLGAVFLLGACGQIVEQTELPGITDMPTEHPVATVVPMEETTSTATPTERPVVTTEPEMTVVPTRETLPTETPTTVPRREELFDEYPTGEPSPSPTPEPVLEEIPVISGRFVADEAGVVIDNEWYSVKIVSLEKNEQSEYVLCVRFENKSDRKLLFGTENHAVNGADVSCGWTHLETEPRACVTKEYIYEQEDLDEYAITEITGVMFELKIQDRGAHPYWPIAECNVFYYPQGEEDYEPYQHIVSEGDAFIGEDEGFKMIVTGIACDDDSEYVLGVYFENKLDCPITIYLDDVFINGFQLEPWRYRTATMGPNRSGYDTFGLGGYVWDAFHIPEITELSFSVAVWSEEGLQYAGWDEPFVLHPLGENAVKTYEYIPDENDITVFDTEECRMVITDVATEYGDTVVTVYMENKTEKELEFECGGLWQEPWGEWMSRYSDEYWYTNLEAGRRMVTELEVSAGNQIETEEGVMHTLLATVSYRADGEETILLQEEAEIHIRNTEE